MKHLRKIDELNYYAIKHGFNNHSDFKRKMKFVLLSMIQLHQSYISEKSRTRYEQVQQLYEQYKDTKLECACCKESYIEFLGIDHIQNNGNEHKLKLGIKIFSNIIDILFSSGFDANNYQILCNNCNISLGTFGYCPHSPKNIRETSRSKTQKFIQKIKEESLFDF